MKKATLLIITILMSISSLTFAAGGKEIQRSTTENKEEEIMPQYREIDAKSVKKMIDNNEEFYFVDVRTIEEYNFSHIPTSKNIPLDVLSDRSSSEFSSKDAKIVLYCRSGARSKIASNALINLGYTNVYDLGAIITWPYELIK